MSRALYLLARVDYRKESPYLPEQRGKKRAERIALIEDPASESDVPHGHLTTLREEGMYATMPARMRYFRELLHVKYMRSLRSILVMSTEHYHTHTYK